MRTLSTASAILVVTIGLPAWSSAGFARLQDEGGTGPGVQINLSGCVVRAADYFKGRPAAERQQIAGDHMVIVAAAPGTPKKAESVGVAHTGGATAEDVPIGTSGATASSSARPALGEGESAVYVLTGDREAELAAYVGHRVELAVQPDPNKKAITPKPVTGVKELPVVTVISFRDLAPGCK
jgi:hypothetical protein